MTAQRWWVRTAARWLARVDGVSGQLRLAMLGLTGVSTGVVALRDYGYGELAAPLILGVGVGMAVFAYYFTEGGVWNQMSRDRQDMSNNYAGPNARIQAEMMARAYLAGQKGDALTEREREAVSEELGATFEELRDGVEIADD